MSLILFLEAAMSSVSVEESIIMVKNYKWWQPPPTSPTDSFQLVLKIWVKNGFRKWTSIQSFMWILYPVPPTFTKHLCQKKRQIHSKWTSNTGNNNTACVQLTIDCILIALPFSDTILCWAQRLWTNYLTAILMTTAKLTSNLSHVNHSRRQ